MSAANDDHNQANKEFAPVPKEAIVKPEDERPVKIDVKPEETMEEKGTDSEYLDTENEDMDGDGSPDWDPAVGGSGA